MAMDCVPCEPPKKKGEIRLKVNSIEDGICSIDNKITQLYNILEPILKSDFPQAIGQDNKSNIESELGNHLDSIYNSTQRQSDRLLNLIERIVL